MSTLSTKKLQTLVSLVSLSFVGAATAQSTLTETVDIAPTPQGLTGTLTFDVPQFDSSLGTLNSVDITLTPVIGDFGSAAVNLTGSPVPAVGFTVGPPTGMGGLVDTALGLNATYTAANTVTSPTYIAAPFVLTDGPVLTGALGFTVAPSSVVVGPSGFVGVGDYDLPAVANDPVFTYSGPGAPLAGAYGNVGGDLTVVYNYSPVPEPSSLALLAMGVPIMIGSIKRRISLRA